MLVRAPPTRVRSGADVARDGQPLIPPMGDDDNTAVIFRDNYPPSKSHELTNPDTAAGNARIIMNSEHLQIST